MSPRAKADALRKLLSFEPLTLAQALEQTGWAEEELEAACEEAVDRGWIVVKCNRFVVLHQLARIEWHVFKPARPVNVFNLEGI